MLTVHAKNDPWPYYENKHADSNLYRVKLQPVTVCSQLHKMNYGTLYIFLNGETDRNFRKTNNSPRAFLGMGGSKHTWLAISYLLLINNVPEIKKIAAHVMTHKTNTNFFWLCPEHTLAVDEK